MVLLYGGGGCIFVLVVSLPTFLFPVLVPVRSRACGCRCVRGLVRAKGVVPAPRPSFGHAVHVTVASTMGALPVCLHLARCQCLMICAVKLRKIGHQGNNFRFPACFVFWGSCFITINRGAKQRISGAGATRARNTGTFWGSCFVTIDRGAKNRISGASATPERKEHAIQGPTNSLLHSTRATI